MKKILKAYTFPVFQIVGVVGISLSSLWYSGWYNKGEKAYIAIYNANETTKSNHINSASFWDVAGHNLLSFDSPVPYTGLSLLLGLVGGFGGFRNQYKINKYDDLETLYREEKSNHGDTQQNYYEAISYIIHSIFVSTNDNYDRNSRVTIYRHTNDNQLKRIYRHASQTRFEHGGRLKIPDNEGIVGAAWLNDGIAHISIDSGFGTQTYQQQLERELNQHGAQIPSETTRMPTRDYFAMAIRGLDRTKMAVVVLENTEPNIFRRERLENIISQENSEIAKYIIHKGKLDEILNPDGGSNNG